MATTGLVDGLDAVDSEVMTTQHAGHLERTMPATWKTDLLDSWLAGFSVLQM